MKYQIKLPSETIEKIKQGKPFKGARIYNALVDSGALNDPEALLSQKTRATFLKLYSAHLSLTVEQEEAINLQHKNFISTAEQNMWNIVKMKAHEFSNPRIAQYIKTAAGGQYEQNIADVVDAFAIVAVANAMADQFKHFNVAQSLAKIYTNGKAGDFPQN
jgi:hypothetical protein